MGCVGFLPPGLPFPSNLAVSQVSQVSPKTASPASATVQTAYEPGLNRPGFHRNWGKSPPHFAETAPLRAWNASAVLGRRIEIEAVTTGSLQIAGL